ncbi:MAG: M56 family metallopeptidase [Pseudanabaenaceae cyanobacterium]|jgi:Zn-dependent protease with chaperone function
MHTSIMLLALVIAVTLRLTGKWLPRFWRSRFCPPQWRTSQWCNFSEQLPWQWRWHLTLAQFLLPVLVLLSMATAVVIMGTQGEMIGWDVGWLGYYLGWGFWLYSLLRVMHLCWQGNRSVQHLGNFEQTDLQPTDLTDLNDLYGQTPSAPEDTALPLLHRAKILEIPALFAAQVGFWDSQLVLSRRLVDTLPPEHLAAVLYHEQAHVYYRDTFWFFWLGCGRHIAPWLPHTEALWQELLLLRELRADRWALNHTDGLLLAEALVTLVQDHCGLEPTFAAGLDSDLGRDLGTDLGCNTTEDRLEMRINHLLEPMESLPNLSPLSLAWLAVGLLPLLLMTLHQ